MNIAHLIGINARPQFGFERILQHAQNVRGDKLLIALAGKRVRQPSRQCKGRIPVTDVGQFRELAEQHFK